jgi:hypothetical protein
MKKINNYDFMCDFMGGLCERLINNCKYSKHILNTLNKNLHKLNILPSNIELKGNYLIHKEDNYYILQLDCETTDENRSLFYTTITEAEMLLSDNKFFKRRNIELQLVPVFPS